MSKRWDQVTSHGSFQPELFKESMINTKGVTRSAVGHLETWEYKTINISTVISKWLCRRKRRLGSFGDALPGVSPGSQKDTHSLVDKVVSI